MLLLYFLVHYEVNNFEELAQVKFQIRHGIVKRSVNVSSTSSPSKLPQTTPSANLKVSSKATTGKPSSTTTNQPSGKATVQPTDINTHRSTEILRNTATDGDNITTRFPQLRTTPVPTNHTNGTNITIVQVT